MEVILGQVFSLVVYFLFNNNGIKSSKLLSLVMHMAILVHLSWTTWRRQSCLYPYTQESDAPDLDLQTFVSKVTYLIVRATGVDSL